MRHLTSVEFAFLFMVSNPYVLLILILITLKAKGVPCGIGGERWTCDPRVSGSSPGTGNLKKLSIWMKIHGLPQKREALVKHKNTDAGEMITPA